MKAIQKSLALILVVSCLAGVVPTALAAENCTYSDVPASHWAHDVIEEWAGKGILDSASGGLFEPERMLTQDEFALILQRAFNYVCTASGGNAVTREQAAANFAQAADIEPVNGVTSFADDVDIDETYKPYVAALQALGYIEGKGDNTFDPKASLTRAESIKILDNIKQPGIKSVSTIGYVDKEGARLSAVAVEYNVDMSGANVNIDTYEITSTFPEVDANYGNGQPGDIVKVYVNNEAAVSEDGGSGTGNYVIIELYTDYLAASEQSSFQSTMAAKVTQTVAIQANGVTIAPSKKAVSNTVLATTTDRRGNSVTSEMAAWGRYDIEGVNGFKIYSNDESGLYGTPDGPAFHASNCFDEKTGTYSDVDLAYALYVPESYNADGRYALVTLENPATSSGTNPLVSVLTTRGPAYLTSDEAQQIVKDEHGLDGLIVLVPTVTGRVDDNGGTPAEYEALVQLWDTIIDEYSIDENYIYGIGQSVGGMVLLETNRNRDNFFAGIMLYENQWGQNYYMDTVFARGMSAYEDGDETAANTPRHYRRTNDYITWDYYYDEDGNKVTEDHDPYNYYYLVSDDNILILNNENNYLSNDVWTEMSYLYSDLVDYSIKQALVDAALDLDEQEQQISAYLDGEDLYNGVDMGLHWITFQGGSQGYTDRKVDSPYRWLLSQSRETEMARPKLDVNKPFELADEQDDSRIVKMFTDPETGGEMYYLTGKSGSGTQFYNTCWLRVGGNVNAAATEMSADAVPGWLPDGMNWETGVTGASIQSVTEINNNGKLTVAVEYDADMVNAVVWLIGDAVVDSRGGLRNDDTVIIDPFDFYANGQQLIGTITKVYINSDAAVNSSAESRTNYGVCDGSGNYLILETDIDWTESIVSVIQRTTIHTDTLIAVPSAFEKSFD